MLNFPNIIRLNGKKLDPSQLSDDKGDFSNKKRPKRYPKSGFGLLRDPGLPKRDLVGSSENGMSLIMKRHLKWKVTQNGM